MNWWKELKGKVKTEELLNKHTTFGIGGRCRYFIEPRDVNDLKLLLKLLKKHKIPFLIIGAGSNILAGDKKIQKAIIHLNSPYFKRIFFKKDSVEIGSGYLLSQFIAQAAKKSFSGYEFLVGIPGTVGGALVMNAGRGEDKPAISDLVEKVSIMDYNSNIKVLRKKDLKFRYRGSNLADFIILSAQLKLIKSDKHTVQNRIKEYINYRKAAQGDWSKSAGCVFKNPPEFSSGKLIDLCGLKGKRVGGAYISDKHANFIINAGKAKAGDVLKLMALVKREVKNKFKINLEPEIKIWQ
ncbi:MAG: UDP-N-acetylmuramate dehydrogenase [Candidatus Omnitrophota bacterium]